MFLLSPDISHVMRKRFIEHFRFGMHMCETIQLDMMNIERNSNYSQLSVILICRESFHSPGRYTFVNYTIFHFRLLHNYVDIILVGR